MLSKEEKEFANEACARYEDDVTGLLARLNEIIKRMAVNDDLVPMVSLAVAAAGMLNKYISELSERRKQLNDIDGGMIH